MLTKQDLNAIGGLIDTKLESKLSPINSNISEIKKDLKHVKKVLDQTAYTLDKDNLSTLARVKRIESNLGISQMEFV